MALNRAVLLVNFVGASLLRNEGAEALDATASYDDDGELKHVGRVTLDATVRLTPNRVPAGAKAAGFPTEFGEGSAKQFHVLLERGGMEIGHTTFIEPPPPPPPPGVTLPGGSATDEKAQEYLEPAFENFDWRWAQYPPHLPYVAEQTGDEVHILGSRAYGVVKYQHQGRDLDGGPAEDLTRRPTLGDSVALVAQPSCRGEVSRDDHDSQPYRVDWRDSCGPDSYLTEEQVTLARPARPVTLGLKDLHRVYTVTAFDKDKALANSEVYLATGRMCGVSPFSAPQLTCDAVSPAKVDYAALQEGVPQRAFGVELEMVARTVDHLPASFGSEEGQSPGRTEGGATGGGLSGNLRKVAQCWDDAKRTAAGALATCSQHAGCALSEFCASGGTCHPRNECTSDLAIDGECPHMMGSWRWETDCTVHPLNRVQAEAILEGADDAQIESETQGVPFELVSAAPPHALAGKSGVRSVAEVLTTLRHMGVQAGPTQGMHVHVNVGKPGADFTEDPRNGNDLTVEQVANVWANYAKYQNVIDEMLQDSRMGNQWAKPLRFASYHQLTVEDEATQEWNPQSNYDGSSNSQAAYSEVALKTFRRLWLWVKDRKAKKDQDDTTFCDKILARYEGATPCASRYPQERYSHVNLAVLNKYGTIEFRAFPASSDPRRVTEWVQFVLRFVEHFKDDGRWHQHGAGQELIDPTLEERVEALEAKVELLETHPEDLDQFRSDFYRLADQQRTASLSDLEAALGADLSYWRRRPWLQRSVCRVPCGKNCQKDLEDMKKQAEDLSKQLEEDEKNGTPYEPEVVASVDQPDSPVRKPRGPEGSAPAALRLEPEPGYSPHKHPDDTSSSSPFSFDDTSSSSPFFSGFGGPAVETKPVKRRLSYGEAVEVHDESRPDALSASASSAFSSPPAARRAAAPSARTCVEHAGCTLDEFCAFGGRSPPAPGELLGPLYGHCKPRKECTPVGSIDGRCPGTAGAHAEDQERWYDIPLDSPATSAQSISPFRTSRSGENALVETESKAGEPSQVRRENVKVVVEHTG